MARCQDARCNTLGSAQFLGDKLVSWSSKKQKSTVISSTEAEYIALSGCLVPSAERVKISSTNIKLETTMPQKKETFQVIVDVINTAHVLRLYNIAECPEIFYAAIAGTTIQECSATDSYLISLSHQDVYCNETVDVSKEFEPEPEPAKKKTFGKRRVKKKVTLSANDNIISDDPDVALELAKSISKSEAKYEEASKKVHATHARIVTESVPKSAKKKSSGRSSKSVVIEDTLICKLLRKVRRQAEDKLGARGSKESMVVNQMVPRMLEWGDEQDSEFSDDDNDDIKKDDKDGDADDEGGDHVSDTQDADDEDVKTESDKDDIYKYKVRVRKDEDVEIKDAEVEGSDKGDEVITDKAKEEAEKTSEAKDDTKKTKLPPSSLSLSVSSGFSDKFLKLSSDSYLDSTVKDSVDADVMTHIISTIQQTTTSIPTPTITTDAPTVTTVVPEFNALTAVELRVAKLEKDVAEMKTVDHSSEAFAILQSQVPTAVNSYLDTKVGDVFQKELQKYTAYLIHKYSLQHLSELTKKPTPTSKQESEKSPSEILNIKMEQVESQKKPQFTIKSTDKAALKEYDLKSALYQSMHANKSFNNNHANHQLYHALMETLIEDENAMDKGVADTVKDHKRKHDDDADDDDEDPSAGPNQGKKTKRRRTKESESSQKPSTTKETPKVEEPIAEVIMDDDSDDVVLDDD
ncbi:hypothetical protein Tco_0002591 [Tanacetum coccineum]